MFQTNYVNLSYFIFLCGQNQFYLSDLGTSNGTVKQLESEFESLKVSLRDTGTMKTLYRRPPCPRAVSPCVTVSSDIRFDNHLFWGWCCGAHNRQFFMLEIFFALISFRLHLKPNREEQEILSLEGAKFVFFFEEQNIYHTSGENHW